MPSVQLVRLRQQAVELAEYFQQPSAFARRLDLVLESYSAKPSRMGEVKGARSVLPAYQAPAQVLKQVHLEVAPLAEDSPELALEVCDLLWNRRMLEPRQFAARLLGNIGGAESHEITSRIEAWCAENREAELLSELAVESSEWLREQRPYELLDFIGTCFTAEAWRQRAMGFMALEALLARTDFPDLPAVFKLLEQVPAELENRVRPYWLDAYRPLVDRSPRETLYHMQQRLNEPGGEASRWLARHLLDDLPGDEQAALRAAL